MHKIEVKNFATDTLSVYTSTPEKLMEELASAISENRITNWFYDEEHGYVYTGEDKRWAHAGLVPRIESNRVVFSLSLFESVPERDLFGLFAICHGRFVYLLMYHFYEIIEKTVVMTKGHFSNEINKYIDSIKKNRL